MLLVDDDQAEPRQRREHRRARADDDVHVAAADAPPLVVRSPSESPLCSMATRVAERARGTARPRRRERDLGHEQQHAAPARERGPRQPEVDLGLAAAGHAVQQGRLERPARSAARAAASASACSVVIGRNSGAASASEVPADPLAKGSRSTARHSTCASPSATRRRTTSLPMPCSRSTPASMPSGVPINTQIAAACFAPSRTVAGSNAAAVGRIQRCLRDASAWPVTTGCRRTAPDPQQAAHGTRDRSPAVISTPWLRAATALAT